MGVISKFYIAVAIDHVLIVNFVSTYLVYDLRDMLVGIYSGYLNYKKYMKIYYQQKRHIFVRATRDPSDRPGGAGVQCQRRTGGGRLHGLSGPEAVRG